MKSKTSLLPDLLEESAPEADEEIKDLARRTHQNALPMEFKRQLTLRDKRTPQLGEDSTYSKDSSYPNLDISTIASEASSVVWSDCEPQRVHQQLRVWFEQLQINQGQTTWLHLPSHSQLSFDILFHKGQVYFAPCRGNTIFIDAEFRRQVPDLAKKLRLQHTTAHHTQESCLLTHEQHPHASPREQAAMAAQLYRAFHKSASYQSGTERLIERTYTTAPPKTAYSFNIEELLPPRAFWRGEPETQALFASLSLIAETCWAFRRQNELDWGHIIEGPDTFDLAKLHGIMNLAQDILKHFSWSRAWPKSWTGVGPDGQWAFIWTPNHIIACRTPLSRQLRLFELLETL